MGRLLTLLMLMILGALAVRTQDPSPYSTLGMVNGVAWRAYSHAEKLAYAAGAMEGYYHGVYSTVWGQQIKGDCLSISAAIPTWLKHADNTTAGDIIKGMDSFYEDGGHISLPMLNAFEYSEMKLAGATQTELSDYLRQASQFIK